MSYCEMISCHEILFFECFLSSLKNVKICSLVFFFFQCAVQKWMVVICPPLPLEYVCLSG